MPPELKRPVTSLNEMTCENCVFSYQYKNEPICCNPDLPDWDIGNDTFCSEGKWLNGIHITNFSTLYQEFRTGPKKLDSDISDKLL